MVADDSVERAIARTGKLAPFLDGTGLDGAADSSRLWVGFSGGVDSTVLLHALRASPRTMAIHIDHGIDPAAPEWVRHCRAVARAFGVAFESRSVRVDSSGNTEHAARTARYRVWRELLAVGDVLALAHHADDQAETRVWQLLTGREPGGMPTERRVGAARLVRPLLSVRRHQILEYAENHGLRWIEDPANADLDFDRNVVRHTLMPRLEERHPGAVERLSAPRPAPVECLRPLPVVEATERGVEAWLLAAGLATPTGSVAEIVRQGLAAKDRNPRIRIAPGIRAWRHGGAWHLIADVDEVRSTPDVVPVGTDLATGTGTLSWRQAEVGLPAGLALSIRRRRGGERIRPVGRNRTKTVKALFQEARIPPWQRLVWPLLYDASKLLAVPGLAVAVEAGVASGYEPSWSPRQ